MQTLVYYGIFRSFIASQSPSRGKEELVVGEEISDACGGFT